MCSLDLDTVRLVDGGAVAVACLLRVLDVGGGLVEPDLLGDSFSSLSVLGARLVLEDGVDLLQTETLQLRGRSALFREGVDRAVTQSGK